MRIKHIIGLLYHLLYKEPKTWWKLRKNRNHPKEVVDEIFTYMGRTMRWDNPQTLDEKIQWLKFNSDTTMWTLLSDKYKVREYVKEKGLGDLLVPLIGKWDRVCDIDWAALPNKFIMKTNHGSADAKICTDKNQIDLSTWKYHFILALHRTYGLNNIELHYSKIAPCIIAEELLDASKQPIPSTSLIDYKVWCVNGVPKYIWACYDRKEDSVQVMMYDLLWNHVPSKCKDTPHYQIAKTLLPPPAKLQYIINSAKDLAEGFPVVRVDFYEVDGKLYFGEMTFTAAGGYNTFYSEEFQREIGEQINLGLAPVLTK